jgi:hypothetical protein
MTVCSERDGLKGFNYGVKGVGRFEALRLALGYALSPVM